MSPDTNCGIVRWIRRVVDRPNVTAGIAESEFKPAGIVYVHQISSSPGGNKVIHHRGKDCEASGIRSERAWFNPDLNAEWPGLVEREIERNVRLCACITHVGGIVGEANRSAHDSRLAFPYIQNHRAVQGGSKGGGIGDFIKGRRERGLIEPPVGQGV